ncbi:glycosyltransferase family 39 protein [Streptomyces sp. Qhu-G9]|uniref:ArnT family glycosyltransferase n=1 Tax=Streptomyces sp. Qhu-G9 TaxID=3452799 RepID=UPI0022ABC8D0|nr:glycosyltransferase family 39 protein [Streptomyces aurantiacus]WAU79531.1 glycosyltransferase family 39 protein [Streptomyces aurantiacus]
MTSATDPHPHAPEAAPAPGRAAAEPPPAGGPPPAGKPPRWSLPALAAIMVLAGVLYSWNLSSSSLNSFYSAAVLSGTQSWKAWFFGSLDAGNFLTVDKPPLALMVMGLSCRVFGYGTWQMMLPLVASALGTIWIVHASVKRVWGHGAAAVAALVLALTPITVAINRDNNPDTLLVLLMVAGAALALRAVHNGRLLPLVGSAVCFGLAFNTKMLQGYIALPAVFAVHLYAARGGLPRRIRNLALAGVALAVSSFWWAAAVSLVPASERPYIGGSTDGTAWNLIMGYNGLGRVLGGEGNGGGGGGGGGGFSGTAGIGRMFNEVLGGQISWLLPFAGIALAGGLVLRGRAPRTDLTRAALLLWGGGTALHYLTFSLAEGTMHPYYTTALAPGIAALCGGGGAMLLHAFRTGDARRWSWVLPVAFATTGVWAVVLLRRATGWNTWLWPTVAAVMVLAIAGLVLFRSGRRARLLSVAVVAAVVASLAGPAAYAASVPAGSGGGMSGTNPTAGPTTGGGMGGGPGGGGGRSGFPGGNGGQAPGGQQQDGQAGGEAPAGGQTGTPPGGAPSGQAPGGGQQQDGQEQGGPEQGGGQAGTPPSGTGSGSGEQGGTGSTRPGGTGGTGGGMGGPGGGADSAMTTYLEKHRDGAKWLVAVSSSQSAAQLIVSTGQPVISMWGWSGSDKAMTLAKLKELVKKGELHYIVLGGAMGGPGGSDSVSPEVTAWVQKHGTAVKASEYGGTSSAGSAGSTGSTQSSESSESSESSGSSDSQNSQALYRLDASDVN